MRYGLKMSVKSLFRRFLQPSSRMLGRLFMSGWCVLCGARTALWSAACRVDVRTVGRKPV